VAHADVPSLFCGDCPYLAHLSGDYGGFPFYVNTTGFPGAHGALFDTSAVPDRRRTYVEPNVVLVGAFMTTVRYETEACVEGEDLFEDKQDATCLVGRKPDGEHPWRYQKARRERFDREPFGVDPTFVSTSPLFRSTNAYETWYDDDELRPTGLPYGFYESGGGRDSDAIHFPVVIDARVNASRYADIIDTLKYGGYVDKQTALLNLRLPLFNEETVGSARVSQIVFFVPSHRTRP
jgi:hypothetical protein